MVTLVILTLTKNLQVSASEDTKLFEILQVMYGHGEGVHAPNLNRIQSYLRLLFSQNME